MDKNKPSSFVIPKKPKLESSPKQKEHEFSPEIPEGYKIIPATPEEKNLLFTEIVRNKSPKKPSLSEECWKHMVPTQIEMIRNAKLEHKFESCKKKQGYDEEIHGYRVVYDSGEIQNISRNGLKTGSDGIGVIGKPSQGVMLYSSPALSYAGRYLFANVPIKVMVFRTVNFVKRNEVPLAIERIPTASRKHNCHVPLKIDPGAAKFHKLTLEHYQAGSYHYEYVPHTGNVLKYHPMILPHAIITFQMQPSVHPSAHKSLSKINRSMLRFETISKKIMHSLNLNGIIINTEIHVPIISSPVPLILDRLTGPSAFHAKSLNLFPELMALRSSENFGKLLVSDSINVSFDNPQKSSVASYFLLKFPEDRNHILKILRNEKRFLVWTRYPWTIFYIPSGDIATEFGFPFLEGMMHLVLMRDNMFAENEQILPSLSRFNRVSLVCDYQTELKTMNLTLENDLKMEEDDQTQDNYPLESPMIESPFVMHTPKEPEKGILRTVGHKPRGLKVRWNDCSYDGHLPGELVQRKVFISDSELPLHLGLTFDEQRKKDEKIEKEKQKMSKEEIDKEAEELYRKEKLDRERTGTDALFKNALSYNNESRTSSVDRETPQTPPSNSSNSISQPLADSMPRGPAFLPTPPMSRTPESTGARPSPTSVPIPPNCSKPPPISITGVPPFSGTAPLPVPPPIRSGNSLPNMSSPPPKLPPGFPAQSQNPTIQGTTRNVIAKVDFNRPPPCILPPTNVPPPNFTPIEPKDEIGEEPMDLDESFDLGHQSSDGAGKAKPQEEENEILKMAFTPAPRQESTISLLSSSQASDAANQVRSLSAIMELLEKKKDNEASASSSSVSLDLNNHTQINFGFNKTKPPPTVPTNVLGEQDDEEEEEDDIKPKDIDYRKSIGNTSGSKVVLKDRDDRIKDIDERLNSIPLPKGTSEEEARKKKSDQMQEKLRAIGKDIESKVQVQHASFAYPGSHLFPSLCAAVFGEHGITLGSQSSMESTSNQPSEPEQIRSPSPEEQYVPKTFLSQQQKCVTVPHESKEGYETYRGERPRSNLENEKSSRKIPTHLRDHDYIRKEESDQKATNSWNNLIDNRKRSAQSEKEDGEIRSDDDRSKASISTSLTETSARSPSVKAAPAFPPGIMNRSRGMSNSPHMNSHPSRIHPAAPVQLHSNNFRGRGRGNYHRDTHHHNSQQHFFADRNWSAPAHEWLDQVEPVTDMEAESFCIFIDPDMSGNKLMPNDLDKLFERLSALRKVRRPYSPRVYATVYLHDRNFSMMKNTKNPTAKFFHTFDKYRGPEHGVVNVIPVHLCDQNGTQSTTTLSECMEAINRHSRAKFAVFLSHSNNGPVSGVGRCMIERGIEVLTIHQFALKLERITGEPIKF